MPRFNIYAQIKLARPQMPPRPVYKIPKMDGLDRTVCIEAGRLSCEYCGTLGLSEKTNCPNCGARLVETNKT